MIKRYSSLKELKTLEPRWRELEKAKGIRIFQSYDWCLLGWVNCLSKCHDNMLYVLEWSQENVKGGVIFPFFVDGFGSLRFIMDCDSDVSNCVYESGANHHIAFKEAWEYIVADKTIKQIHLEKMDAESEVLNFWGALSIRESNILPVNAYSWIELTATEDFAKSQPQLRSKDKANVRALRRKAEKYQLRVLSLSAGQKYPEEAVNYIASDMRGKGIREDTFLTGSFSEFCRDIYNNGMADILELVNHDGQPVAINFILNEAHRKLSWVLLYTDSHASTELYVKYFYNYTETDSLVFDFGSGSYEYKTGTFRPNMRLLFSLTMPLASRIKFRFLANSLFMDLKRIIKFCIGRK